MPLQQRARTNRYQVDDLVHVELGAEGAVQPGEQHSRRDRVLEMTSRHCQFMFFCGSTEASSLHQRIIKTHDGTVDQREIAGEMGNRRHSWTQRGGQTKPREGLQA
jgi:hypothetical protein